MSEYNHRQDEDTIFSEAYCAHVNAMTGEKLHSKAEIAAELAYRDNQISELLESQRWVPVSERLPEDRAEFLGLLCDGGIDHYKMDGERVWCVNSRNLQREDFIGEFLTHWQPLPPIPIGE